MTQNLRRPINSRLVEAGKAWIEEFKQLPAEKQAEFFGCLATGAVLGKPIGAIQMKLLGVGLGAAARGAPGFAKRVVDVIKKAPELVAETPEGLKIPVKIAGEIDGAEGAAAGLAAREGAMLQEDEDVGKTGGAGKRVEAIVEVGPYSGELVKVPKPDVQAEKLLAQRFKDGQTCMKFKNDPSGTEFDIITKDFIVETKPALRSIKQGFRDQAKRIFEAAKQTNRKVYFHFNGEPCNEVIKKLKVYQSRFKIEMIIDTIPLD